MSEKKVSFSYRTQIRGMVTHEDESAEMKTLLAIRDSLTILTAGCEVCQFNIDSWCQKNKRAVKEGDPRCDYFARRFSRPLGDTPKAQVQAYVNEMLGIKGETLQRLTR